MSFVTLSSLPNRQKFALLLIIILLFLIRLIPILLNSFCFTDDCPIYYNVILNKETFKEPLFYFISFVLYSLGINEIWVMRIFMTSLPLFFSFGLYILLRKKFKFPTVFIIIFSANTILSINLFWFVLIRNGLMLVFLPYALYYLLEKKYNNFIIFTLFMLLSHISSIFFIIPMILYMIGKTPLTYSVLITFISLSFVIFYYPTYTTQISTLQITNLNYIQTDIFFLFFALMGMVFIKKKSLYKSLFIFIAIITVVMFFVYQGFAIMLGKNFGWYAGFAIYWPIFCVIIPVLLIGSSQIIRKYDYS